MPRPNAAKVIADAQIESNMETIAHKERIVHEAASLQRLAAEMYHQAGILIAAERASIEQLRLSNLTLEAGRRSQVAA